MGSSFDVSHVAKLARLSITAEEEKTFSSQLQSILGHFNDIEKINTVGVEPLITPTPMEITLRPDEVEISLNLEDVKSIAPEMQGGLFKVPPVVG